MLKVKNMDNYTQMQLKAGNKTFYTVQKEVRSMQKQPNCKNWWSQGEKSCEIKGGGQETGYKYFKAYKV